MAALFLYLGGTKLLGTTESVRPFDMVGIGSWFRYVTGALELIGAGLLFSPTFTRAASFPRTLIVAVVAIIEIFVLKRPPAAAAVCVTAHAFITWGRRQNARWIAADAAQGLGESLPTAEQWR
jgi:putative oxidoreductase